jgi:hypothetical protein
MNVPTLALIVSLGALAGGSALAQQQPVQAPQPRVTAPAPTPAQPPRVITPPPTPAPAVAPAARRQTQPINVKVDLSITDQRAGSPPIKRTLSVIVADGYTGSIRSQSEVLAVGSIPLNVDADPELLSDGKIRLRLNVQYDWPAPLEGGRDAPRGTVIKTALHNSVALILESGQAVVAAQSADPIGDRQVTVEVKATILR